MPASLHFIYVKLYCLPTAPSNRPLMSPCERDMGEGMHARQYNSMAVGAIDSHVAWDSKEVLVGPH